jgi:predicted hydrocarbon binding protein
MADLAHTTLKVTADLSDQRLDALTREFARDLTRMGVTALPAERKSGSGERGDLMTVGALVLSLVATEMAKEAAKEIGKEFGRKLLECIKTYLSRERTAKFALTKADGAQVTVDRNNVDSPDIRKAIEDLPRVAS